MQDLTDSYVVPEEYLTLQASQYLKEWQALMREDPEVGLDDPQALAWWQTVIRHPLAGKFEANRVLYHLLKHTRTERDGWNIVGWFIGACKESLAALDSPSEWSSQEQRRRGLQYLESGVNRDGSKRFAWIYVDHQEPQRPWRADHQEPQRPWREPSARGYGWASRDYHYGSSWRT